MGRYFDLEEDLLHYGVLGMKWGIRRYQPYSYTGGSGKEVGEAAKKGTGRKLKDAIKSYKRKKNLAKARKIRAQKKKDAEQELYEKRRKIAEITKDATTLAKNNQLARELLSNEEYDKIKNRLVSEQAVYDESIKQQKRIKSKIDMIIGYSETLSKIPGEVNKWMKFINGESSNNQQNNNQNNQNQQNKKDKNKNKNNNNNNSNKQTLKEMANMARAVSNVAVALSDLKEITVQVDPKFLLEDKQKKR